MKLSFSTRYPLRKKKKQLPRILLSNVHTLHRTPTFCYHQKQITQSIVKKRSTCIPGRVSQEWKLQRGRVDWYTVYRVEQREREKKEGQYETRYAPSTIHHVSVYIIPQFTNIDNKKHTRCMCRIYIRDSTEIERMDRCGLAR